MNLAILLDTIFDKTIENIVINHLCLDSRLIQKGDLFFAVKGEAYNGEDYIDEAINKGASIILREGPFAVTYKNNIPLIFIPNLKVELCRIAAKFYHYPSRQLKLIGVTGTSGKTSCTHFLAQVLNYLQIPCGLIGTLGYGILPALTPTLLTTEDAITLQKILNQLLKQGAKAVAMEVSSHSLEQGRVKELSFLISIFTNLSQDHLDYHKTMDDYFAAKKKLFFQSEYAVINMDDPYGEKLYADLSLKKIITYAINNKKAAIRVLEKKITAEGINAAITTPWGEGLIKNNLLGEFNLSNVLSVIGALCLLDIPLQKVLNAVQYITSVSGRMQFLGGGSLPIVVVDYAHKPDALEKVLATLRSQCIGKLICVFGCGGDRDRVKRPIMAKIAERYADKIIVTDDNPRFEDKEQIVNDIMQGFVNKRAIMLEHDRGKAIKMAIALASVQDYVLIAGKGAETYQQIGNLKKPFNDMQTAKYYLQEKSQ